MITKDSRRSPVHRPAYLDYIGIRSFDAQGRLVGERRFIGLFAAAAYSEPVWTVPTLAEKAQIVIDRSGFAPQSHGSSAIRQVLATYPRDELFQATADELFPVISQEAQFKDRRLVRVFVRRGTYGRFVSVLVYLPRDRYTTDVREAIQHILLDELGGESLEHQARVSEGALARLFFVVKRPDGDPLTDPVDVAALQTRIEGATRSWDDNFENAARELASEARGVEFSDAYEEEFPAAVAVKDLKLANQLTGPDDRAYDVYAPSGRRMRPTSASRCWATSTCRWPTPCRTCRCWASRWSTSVRTSGCCAARRCTCTTSDSSSPVTWTPPKTGAPSCRSGSSRPSTPPTGGSPSRASSTGW